MFSLESSHRGDSNENTPHTENHPQAYYCIWNNFGEIIPNTIICLRLWDFLLGTQERVRNSGE